MSQVSIQVVIRGYQAFVSGDLETISELLAPEIEWVSADHDAPVASRRDDVLEVLGERLGEGYRVELDRCIGVGDQVVVAARFMSSGGDPADERPLQTRRYYTVGRYACIVTIADGRVARVEDYPHLAAALEAIGVDDSH